MTVHERGITGCVNGTENAFENMRANREVTLDQGGYIGRQVGTSFPNFFHFCGMP